MQLTNAILKSSRHATVLAECLAGHDLASALQLVLSDLIGSSRDAVTWCTLGALYRLQGNWERSADAFGKALALNPHSWAARAGLGCVRLTQGRFAEGWHDYRARWRLPGWRGRVPYPPDSIWDGIQRRGDVVVLWCGEDQGSAIQFSRFVPWLASLGLDVRLQAPPALSALFETQWPELLHSEGRHGFTRHLPLGDLLATWQGVPAGTLAGYPPYLHIAGAMRGAGHAPAVGLAYASGDACLSPPVERERWVALRGAGFVEWVDLDACKAASLDESLLPLARRIAALDLVITSDSTTAHLAAALGRPTWLVLGPVPDPVWLLEREDSPWYPSLRLFRHQGGKDAAQVLDRVAQAMAEWAVRLEEAPVLTEVVDV